MAGADRALDRAAMDEDRLYRDAALAAFYDLDNGWTAADDFSLAMAADAGSALDLGCGTGLLAAALADGRAVTGVDPATAMLDIARGRPGGDRVEWLEADARTVRLGRVFDLVLLAGHAFQVFLTRADRRAVLDTIAAHLAPGGRFVFDSRNPAVEEWREWTPERARREVQHPVHGRVEAWNDVVFDPGTGIAAYETHYRLPDGTHLSAVSRIAFPDRDELAKLIDEAGLEVDRWHGDWQGGDWRPDTPEIIPVGRLRRADRRAA